MRFALALGAPVFVLFIIEASSYGILAGAILCVLPIPAGLIGGALARWALNADRAVSDTEEAIR